MGRVKSNADNIIHEIHIASQKAMYEKKRKLAKDSLEEIKKRRPHLTFSPQREEEYIDSFIKFKDLWEN